MKKLLLLLLLFPGCDLIINETEPNCDYSFQHKERFADRTEIFDWMWHNYKYIPDQHNEWKAPEDTYLNGGDCEDWIILLMYFLHEIGIDSRLVVVYNRPYDERHCIIKVDGEYLEYSGVNNKFMFDNGTYTLIVERDYCEAIALSYIY
jgi:hypothetical protein